MKKRILMVAVMFGALFTTTSCLDDNESDSVKGVRNAKAAALNAVAALKNAEAKVQESLAAYNDAVTAWQLQQNEQDAAEFAINLEVLKAQAEKDILEALVQAQGFEFDLVNDKNGQATTLYGQYGTINSEVYGLRGNLVEWTAQLAGLKAGIISAEALVAQTTYTEQRTIAEEQAKIKAYKEYSSLDRDEVYAEYSSLKAQSEDLTNQLEVADAARKTATNNLTDAEIAMNYTNYESSSTQYVAKPLASVAAIEGLVDLDASYLGMFDTDDIKGSSALIYSIVQSRYLVERSDLMYEVDERTEEYGKKYTSTTPDEGRFANLFGNAGLTYKSLVDDVATARTNLTADPTDRDLKEALRLAEAEVKRADEWLVGEREDLDDAIEKLAKFNGYIAAFTDGTEAYEAAIANIEKLVIAKDAANEAYKVIYEKQRVVDAAKGVALTLYNDTNATDIDKLIIDCEKAIADAQKTIDSLTDVADAEKLLALKEAQIAEAESKIAFREIQLAYIIAELEDLLGSL